MNEWQKVILKRLDQFFKDGKKLNFYPPRYGKSDFLKSKELQEKFLTKLMEKK